MPIRFFSSSEIDEKSRDQTASLLFMGKIWLLYGDRRRGHRPRKAGANVQHCAVTMRRTAFITRKRIPLVHCAFLFEDQEITKSVSTVHLVPWLRIETAGVFRKNPDCRNYVPQKNNMEIIRLFCGANSHEVTTARIPPAPSLQKTHLISVISV